MLRETLHWDQGSNRVVDGAIRNGAMWWERDKLHLRQPSRRRRRKQNRNPNKADEMTDGVPVGMYSETYKSSYLMKYPIYPKRLSPPIFAREIAPLPNLHVNIHNPSIHASSTLLSHQGYLSVFRPHFDALLDCFISIAFAFVFAFSRSTFVIRGVGGTSSIFDMPFEFLF